MRARCPECQLEGRRGYCAPRRCYCGHRTCYAFASWYDVRASQTPPTKKGDPSDDSNT